MIHVVLSCPPLPACLPPACSFETLKFRCSMGSSRLLAVFFFALTMIASTTAIKAAEQEAIDIRIAEERQERRDARVAARVAERRAARMAARDPERSQDRIDERVQEKVDQCTAECYEDGVEEIKDADEEGYVLEDLEGNTVIEVDFVYDF